MNLSVQNWQMTMQIVTRYTGQNVVEFFYTVKRKNWPKFKYFAIIES